MGNIDPVEVAYIIKYHKDLISQYPQDDNLTMGWAGDSQNVRFKVLSEIDRGRMRARRRSSLRAR